MGIMAITNVFKLFKDGKRFKKESKQLIRSNIAIPRAYVEEKNDKWEENGLWHEIDEEKTKEYYAWGEKKVAKRVAEAEAKEKLKSVLTDVLVKGSQVVEKKKDKVKVKPVVDADLKELQEEYKKVVGKKLVGKWSTDVKWMKKKIKESKNK